MGSRALLGLAIAPVLLSGCTLARAQVGVGLGLGADVKLPALAHTGLGAGEFVHVGPRYDQSFGVERETIVNVPGWHWEGARGTLTADEYHRVHSGDLSPGAEAAARSELRRTHACAGGLPAVTTYSHGPDQIAEASLEVGLMLGLFDILIGFNPLAGIP